MTVTKQQQLEWLALNIDDFFGCDVVHMSTHLIGEKRMVLDSKYHAVTREEWQLERDKMQKQGEKADSWHELGERPPVGCECEVFDGDDWLKSFIVGRSRSGDVVVQTRNGYFEASHAKFRPLRTEREKAIENMARIIADHGGVVDDISLGALVDAGFKVVKS